VYCCIFDIDCPYENSLLSLAEHQEIQAPPSKSSVLLNQFIIIFVTLLSFVGLYALKYYGFFGSVDIPLEFVALCCAILAILSISCLLKHIKYVDITYTLHKRT
jgi:hypothetical protein